MSKYQTLDAWKITMDFVTDIYRVTETFPSRELYVLTSQIRRAALSIPSNIAEGMGRQYKKDTIQFLHIARGSLYELETLLEIAYRTGMFKLEASEIFLRDAERALQLLNGLIKYLQRSKLK